MTLVARFPRWPYAFLAACLLLALPVAARRVAAAPSPEGTTATRAEGRIDCVLEAAPLLGPQLRVRQQIEPSPFWIVRSTRLLVDREVVWTQQQPGLHPEAWLDRPAGPGVHLVEVEVTFEEAIVDSRRPESRTVRRTAAVRVDDEGAELVAVARASADGYDLRFDFR